MIMTALNLSELVEEADRRFPREWRVISSYEDGVVVNMADGNGWTRSQTAHRLQIRDERGLLVFDMETDRDITPDFIQIGFRASIPVSGNETRTVTDEAMIGFGVKGYFSGSMADIVKLDKALRKTVKRLRKAGCGSLQIDLAKYGRDRSGNLVQMSFDSWEASRDGDVSEECVYLCPDTRYTNIVCDRVLVEGSLEELQV